MQQIGGGELFVVFCLAVCLSLSRYHGMPPPPKKKLAANVKSLPYLAEWALGNCYLGSCSNVVIYVVSDKDFIIYRLCN